MTPCISAFDEDEDDCDYWDKDENDEDDEDDEDEDDDDDGDHLGKDEDKDEARMIAITGTRNTMRRMVITGMKRQGLKSVS